MAGCVLRSCLPNDASERSGLGLTAVSNEQLFRAVMGRFATGITVITTELEGDISGMTANAFMAGSLSPPLCVISIARTARTCERLNATRQFGVSLLSESQQTLSDHFARRYTPGVVPTFTRIGGVPVLQHSLAAIAADVVATADCGDHLLFIGHILGMEAADGQPLLYYQGKYSALYRARRAEPIEAPEFW
jgi:flavin reductase